MTIRAVILAVAFLNPISAGALGAADCVAVFDTHGQRVGRLQSSGKPEDNPVEVGFYGTVYVTHAGDVIPVDVAKDHIRAVSPALTYWDEPSCTGAAFMSGTGSPNAAWLMTRSMVVDGGPSVYYSDKTATSPQTVNVRSFIQSASNHVCTNGGSTIGQLYPALEFTWPFSPPYHVEAEACFTPTPELSALGPRSLLAMVVVLGFWGVLMMKRPLQE